MREMSSVTSIRAGSTAYSVPANSKGSSATASMSRRPSPLESVELGEIEAVGARRHAFEGRSCGDARHGPRRARPPAAGARAARPAADPSRPGEVLVEVHACGVCRTDLHIRDGEVRGSRLPVIPGHQIVATVLAAGPDAAHAPARAWASRGWAGPTGRAASARAGARTSASARASPAWTATAATRRCAVADARYAFALPEGFGDLEAAPLLCAGLIGHRALRMTGDAAAPRALRLRRQRPHRLPGRAASGPARVRLHARRTTRPRRPSRSSSAASGRATRWARRPRSSTRRSSSPPSASSCPRRCARSGAAGSSCARAST